MKHSVLIPAYRQHELTKVHVRECMNSSVIPDEIIVVNDHGDPSLKEMLKSLELKTKVVYAYILEDINWNYNGAVNLAFWLSRGDYISIEDTDHIPQRNVYKDAIGILDTQPEINRIHYWRQWVPIADTQTKPFEEWERYGSLGPNQMVTMLRREVYQMTKGQDERLCGRYGYMAYTWVAQYKRLGVQTAQVNSYYIVKDGSEPGMVRGMSPENRKTYREIANGPYVHSKHGVLNFEFEFETL